MPSVLAGNFYNPKAKFGEFLNGSFTIGGKTRPAMGFEAQFRASGHPH
jgi:hypothetical protein